MCMIIDANRLGRFLSEPPDIDAQPIRKWLEQRGGRLIYCTDGAFKTEIGQSARTKLRQLAQSGCAVLVENSRVEENLARLPEQIRSDDKHVLALAAASGARLLYTGDQKLMADFKDKAIIDGPRGKIYSGAKNATMLTRSACAQAF